MKNFTFKLRLADIAVIIGTALLVVILKLIGVTEIPENSLVENIQLIALCVGILFCFFTRNNPEYKTLNRFIAMILVLMFLRELSYGRCIFCKIDGNPHEFYSWKHYQYGYLAHIFVGLYIAAVVIYGFVNKIFIQAWNALTTVKFPVISAILAVISIISTFYGEKVVSSSFVEEIAELSVYSIIACVIFYYNDVLSKPNA